MASVSAPASGSASAPVARSPVSRRLALNACDACRLRKTKCDEGQPCCGRCKRLELSCTYTNNTLRKPPPPGDVALSLSKIDAKLDRLLQSVVKDDSAQPPPDPSPRLSQGRLTSFGTPGPEIYSYFPFINQNQANHSLAIPVRHVTAPQHLLEWPCSPLRLTPVELNYDVSLAIRRRRMTHLAIPPCCLTIQPIGPEWLRDLSLSQLQQLISSYFESHHPQHPILDRAEFYSRNLANTILNKFQPSMDSCLVLLVMALGSITVHESGHGDWASQTLDDDAVAPVGVGFFNLALSMMQQIEETNWQGVQCRLLMSLFHASHLRTYDQWVAINQACSTTLLLLSTQDHQEPLHIRIYWMAYLLESQLLAEISFPPSGLSRLESSISLPYGPDIHDNSGPTEQQFFFLALISMRRLLNRIHSHLYTPDKSGAADEMSSPASQYRAQQWPASQRALIHELDRQLEEWRNCLPDALKFPIDSTLTNEICAARKQPRSSSQKLVGHLAARYFAAKSVLYRPFLYHVLIEGLRQESSEEDRRGACTAVEAGLKCVVFSGVLTDPIPLLFHPINTCRRYGTTADLCTHRALWA
ncbi:hypothetical protein FALCPG4_018519 [Fusarium falciforme]